MTTEVSSNSTFLQNSQSAAPPEKKDNFSSGKITKVVSRWRGGDLALGIVKSKFFIAALFSGLAVAALYGLAIYVFGFYPSAWMIAAASTGGFALGILIQLPFKGLQKGLFETSAIGRLIKGKDYDTIYCPEKGKLILGALPNRLNCGGERLVNKEGVSAVLSINEPWERKPQGLSLPYTEKDWKELGVTYKGINADDHKELTEEQLKVAAQFIDEQMKQGKTVYVHCRAGRGRSAMAVIEYLVKYCGKNPNDAVSILKIQRSSVTIDKKKNYLAELSRDT